MKINHKQSFSLRWSKAIASFRAPMVPGTLACVTAALLLFHGATYLLWAYEARRSGVCGAAPTFSWRAWLVEAFALGVVVVSWPIGLFAARRDRARSERRPVLLVHGWSLNRASMLVLAARLRRDGRTALAINYPSLLAETDAKAVTIAKALCTLARESPDGKVDVVGHSLGGVLVRAAARDEAVLAIVGNVVTLGSPHRGTALALLGRRFGLIQIRPCSHYLERLASEDRLADTTNLTTIASPFDAIVFPTDNAHWPGALNVTVEDVGHHTLLYSARVYALLRENLDSFRSQAAA